MMQKVRSCLWFERGGADAGGVLRVIAASQPDGNGAGTGWRCAIGGELHACWRSLSNPKRSPSL